MWRRRGQESSQVRSAQSARSYEGMEHVAKPTAARRSWPRWSSARSLDELVGPPQHRRRAREHKPRRRLEVYHQLDLGRLLDGEVGRLRSLEDLVDVGSRATI